MDDLANGRLPVQARYRENVEPLPVVDDGTFRLGQSNERVRDLQRVMADEGYRVTDGGALDQDGVYRPGMQGALLDFQRAHGLPQTGDIDPATLRMAPAMRHRVVDREDRSEEHTSELQSLMRISYAVFSLKKKKSTNKKNPKKLLNQINHYNKHHTAYNTI